MRHLLDQLYKTKLQLLAVILTVSGVALLVVAHWIDVSHPPHWLTNLPLTDLGSALFTTGLLAVAFEYIDRKDGESRTRQQLREVLRDEAPAIRDAVYDGFAFNSLLSRLLSGHFRRAMDGSSRDASPGVRYQGQRTRVQVFGGTIDIIEGAAVQIFNAEGPRTIAPSPNPTVGNPRFVPRLSCRP